MLVQTNTDHNVEGGAALEQQTQAAVESALGHLAQRVSRVEVHLSDSNSHKGGSNDKRCLMEARVEGQQPTVVTDDAGTIDQAIDGAAEKLRRSLESTLGRLDDR